MFMKAEKIIIEIIRETDVEKQILNTKQLCKEQIIKG
jgi:hypothetical protein